jgi:hypothetical protein
MLHSHCRSCEAAIIWARHEVSQKLHPFDAVPVDAMGMHTFVLREHGFDVVAIATPPGVFADEPHYVSHFSTCPHAELWRTPRSKEATT